MESKFSFEKFNSFNFEIISGISFHFKSAHDKVKKNIGKSNWLIIARTSY